MHPPASPYSPDLAPCDFKLFPALKKELCGEHFRNVKDLQEAVRKILLKMDKAVYSDGIYEMVGRWQKCVANQGDYFEGDHIHINPLFVRGQQSDSSSDFDSDAF